MDLMMDEMMIDINTSDSNKRFEVNGTIGYVS
jgi:hypothetical protein